MHSKQSKPSNPLLVKIIVGKPKNSVYDLPKHDHTYGIPSEGPHKTSNASKVPKKTKPSTHPFDYITMNRNSAKSSITSAHDVALYRLSHPVQLKIGNERVLNSAAKGMDEKYWPTPGRRPTGFGVLPSDGDCSFTYGKHSEVCTPVGSLLTDQFQREWIEGRERKEVEKIKLAKENLKKKHQKTVVPKNRPQPKKEGPLDKDVKSLFKMTKFKNKDARIDCWRKEGLGFKIVDINEEKQEGSLEKKIVENETVKKEVVVAETDETVGGGGLCKH